MYYSFFNMNSHTHTLSHLNVNVYTVMYKTIHIDICTCISHGSVVLILYLFYPLTIQLF